MKPKVLVVLSRRLPHQPDSGFGIRIWQSVRALAGACDLDLLFLEAGAVLDAQVAPLSEVFRNVYGYSFSRAEFATRAIGAAVSEVPVQVAAYSPPNVRAWLKASQRRYDAILGHHVRMADLLGGLDIPIALDLTDAVSLSYERAAEFTRGVVRLAYQAEMRRLRSFEVDVINSHRRSFVASEVDRQHLISLGADAGRISTVPVAVRADIVDRPVYQGPQDEAVVFLGKMSYHPNRDAAIFFATQVLPRIHERRPGCKFIIAGSNPSKDVRDLANLRGVEVTGFLDDPFAVLERCKVVVAPIRFGAGMQNKVVEPMALRRPVVTSLLAAEAIGAHHDRHLLVADDAESFAQAVTGCLEHDVLRHRLGTGARRHIEANFAPEAVSRRFREEFLSVLGVPGHQAQAG